MRIDLGALQLVCLDSREIDRVEEKTNGMAGLVKRALMHLGFFKGDANTKHRTEKTSSGGFSVKSAVQREPTWNSPILYQCAPGTGGVQGLRWYTEQLQMDEDGDVAQEFLDEVESPSSSSSDTTSKRVAFQVKSHTRPVKPKGPICTLNGNIHQSVDTSEADWR